MSEQLMVCKALAAMVRSSGEVNEEEVSFVAHAAFELALSQEDNDAVQQVLKEGGDYGEIIKGVTSKTMRVFLFRRVVAAILLDEQVDDDEQAVINTTSEAFGFDGKLVGDFVGWMKDGIAWEKRGAKLMAKL